MGWYKWLGWSRPDGVRGVWDSRLLLNPFGIPVSDDDLGRFFLSMPYSSHLGVGFYLLYSVLTFGDWLIREVLLFIWEERYLSMSLRVSPERKVYDRSTYCSQGPAGMALALFQPTFHSAPHLAPGHHRTQQDKTTPIPPSPVPSSERPKKIHSLTPSRPTSPLEELHSARLPFQQPSDVERVERISTSPSTVFALALFAITWAPEIALVVPHPPVDLSTSAISSYLSGHVDRARIPCNHAFVPGIEHLCP